MKKRVAFRTDASLQIGIGHVMRCLTLADALKARGAECEFISREHPGHMLGVIRQRGHAVTALPAGKPSSARADDSVQQPAHAAWLCCDWSTDARQTGAILASLQPDWLVVDHYALDQRWEEACAPHSRKLLVIDDLADRPHRCDLLLDQNLGRQPEHYAQWVPAYCQVLTGPQYALLRPEFAALRPYNLQRRQAQPALRQLLITMGGVDQPNATGQVLQALKTCALPAVCRITVVMGLTAPWLQSVRELAAQMPWPTEVVVNVSDMAQRMADSDLAIGAAGSTSWERCCLGLPTLMVVLANNQRPSAKALQEAQASRLIGGVSEVATQLPLAVQALTQDHQLMRMSTAASAVTDGQGVDKVLQALGVLID
ncbi:MAG: UDP-2,4-diacetamido-2,4,6-trideoxy-beta-L-altropyranose hydrolase [Burkholderiaceae bacterium]